MTGGSREDDFLAAAFDWVKRYAETFYRDSDERVIEAVRLKIEHTEYVRYISRDLAHHLGLSAADCFLAELIGILHDVGRFRQFQLYKTFKDAISADHAEMGLEVLKNWPDWATVSAADKKLIEFSILNHNKKEIARTKEKRPLFFAKLIRDADKLDIFRVLLPYLKPSDGKGISPDFVEKFCRGEQCDYTAIRTIDDAKLVRLMWVYDVNFSWTLRKIGERGYIDTIISCLELDENLKLGVSRLKEYFQKKCAAEDFADI